MTDFKLPPLNRVKCGPVIEFKIKWLRCTACGFKVPMEPNPREDHFWYDQAELDYYHANNKVK